MCQILTVVCILLLVTAFGGTSMEEQMRESNPSENGVKANLGTRTCYSRDGTHTYQCKDFQTCCPSNGGPIEDGCCDPGYHCCGGATACCANYGAKSEGNYMKAKSPKIGSHKALSD